MNSLEITAYKAYTAHRKAFDTWDNGNIDILPGNGGTIPFLNLAIGCGGKHEKNT